jgi:curved DNA-binding protein
LAVKFKDYYETLGVARDASDKDIKAAYRKLARQHHPDANKGKKSSEEKFKEINEAYEVLKDPEKRRRYDQLGSNYKAGTDFHPPPDFGGFNFDFGNLGDLGRNPSFSDFFDVLFGQSGHGTFQDASGLPPGQGRASSRNRRGADQEAQIELTIEELAKGAVRNLQISGPNQKPKTLEVKIPAGVRPGSKIRVAGEGGQSSLSGAAGDLFLKVEVKPHPYFSIEGENLISNLSLSPAQAVVGVDTTVNTLNGPITIHVPAGSQNGRLLRLRGRGLPKLKSGVAGDQLVRLKISIPVNISDQERKLYEELAKLEADKSPT